MVCAKVNLGRRDEGREAAMSPNGSSSGGQWFDAVSADVDVPPADFLRDFPAAGFDVFLVDCVFLRGLTGDSELK